MFANAYFNRGLIRANRGEVDAALADYDSTIAHNPALVSSRHPAPRRQEPMKKRRQRQTSHVDVQRLALRRTLAYLAAIRTGVPIPVVFIENLVSGDLMLEGPHQTVLENLTAAPAIINVSLDQLYHLTIQDAGRAAISVTEAQLPAIRRVLQELGPDDSWVAMNGLGDAEMSCASELHLAASINADEYTPDQRALLAVHGLYWLEHALAQPDSSGAYGAVQLYDALWLLYDHEAIALSELTPLLPRVIVHCEQHGAEWGEAPPFFYLSSVAEGLAEAGEADLRAWAERAFALAEHLAADLSTDDQKTVAELLKKARSRVGMGIS